MHSLLPLCVIVVAIGSEMSKLATAKALHILPPSRAVSVGVRFELTAIEAGPQGALVVRTMRRLHSVTEPAGSLLALSLLVVELVLGHAAPSTAAIGAIVFEVRFSAGSIAPAALAIETITRVMEMQRVFGGLGLIAFAGLDRDRAGPAFHTVAETLHLEMARIVGLVAVSAGAV